jgi:hypothetical protein
MFNYDSAGVASGFTYDGSLMPKHFVYNSVDNAVYFMYENSRYEDSPAFLVKAEFATATLTLTKQGDPSQAAFGSKTPLIVDGTTGNVFGVTKGDVVKLWEYGTAFWPRIELARFSERDDVKDIIGFICELAITHYIIHSEREFRMVKRGSSNGSKTLTWGKHLVKSRPDIPYWKHFYDAVLVDWEDAIDGRAGSRKVGYDGWERKLLTIQNPLIQNFHLANIVKDEAYSYFNTYRLNPSKVIAGYLFQMELLDDFSMVIPSFILDILSSDSFVIEELKLSQNNRQITLKGIEI